MLIFVSLQTLNIREVIERIGELDHITAAGRAPRWS
jgi:hypothetical protein